MRFAFRPSETLPRLAWCARLIRQSPVIDVLHGPDVEVADRFFCEGAWAGEFQHGELDRHLLLGSGGRLMGERVVFAAPHHTMERLYTLRLPDALLVSNSLAFVFAQAEDAPDPRYLFYAGDIASIIHGLHRYQRTLPTRARRRIEMYAHCNVSMGSALEVREEPKSPSPTFVSYEDYTAFLGREVAALAANAQHPRRHVCYRPIATISSGYDSPASAVIARAIGCDEAVTFARARGGACDSGARIAEILGMKVRTFDRLDYLRLPGYPEAEAGISEFPALGDAVEQRMLFTGMNGGAPWDLRPLSVGPFLQRKDTNGNSLAEFRLRAGFIHVPVPYLGCVSHESLYAISLSEAMRPWRVGGDYDKPIARRLVEEAGVPRGLFGTTKKAVAVGPEGGFQPVMTPASFADLSRFIAAHAGLGTDARLALYRVLRDGDLIAGKVSRRILRRPWFHRWHQTGLERVVRWGRYSLMFHWSIERLRERYTV